VYLLSLTLGVVLYLDAISLREWTSWNIKIIGCWLVVGLCVLMFTFLISWYGAICNMIYLHLPLYRFLSFEDNWSGLVVQNNNIVILYCQGAILLCVNARLKTNSTWCRDSVFFCLGIVRQNVHAVGLHSFKLCHEFLLKLLHLTLFVKHFFAKHICHLTFIMHLVVYKGVI
jgi:hypothetical protein